MARKTMEVTITAAGRDKGKLFFLTEMPASQAEEWAMRALMALTKAGVEVPDPSSGMAGIAVAGLQSLGGLSFPEVKDLLKEMFACIKLVPDPKVKSVMRDLVEDDIEEVQTRLMLRLEVFALHTGFSVAELLSKRTSAKAHQGFSHTPTSPQQ